jgi:hypothetical protein
VLWRKEKASCYLSDGYLKHRSMLMMFLGFLPQYCCISDFDDMINSLRSYEVVLNMAAHQVGGKFALWQDLWRKWIKPSEKSIDCHGCVGIMWKIFSPKCCSYVLHWQSTATAVRSFLTLRWPMTYFRTIVALLLRIVSLPSHFWPWVLSLAPLGLLPQTTTILPFQFSSYAPVSG